VNRVRIAAISLLTLAATSLFAAEVPRKAPEFVIYLPQGGHKLLSEFRGKVVALEFLFTTCPHCLNTANLMNRLSKEYGPKGFQPLGVAFNPMSKMLVPDFLRDSGATYLIGFSERDPVTAFLQADPNQAMHVPQLVFIDRKGMIRQQSLPREDVNTATEANMRRMIETLLAEPAAATAKPKPVRTKAKANAS
jgi:thiol-disulfide isomerase/thioredoxin